MTRTGKLAASYVRVSSEEQLEGYSLDAQVRAIDTWAAQNGYDLVTSYRDEGKSARSDDLKKRPDFSRMIADAEARRFDVIIAHKLDRFARNLRVLLETLDRLERADVGFYSVSENMDFATPMGRVVLSTMGSLAQFYSDNLSAETKKVKRERKEQGLHNDVLPFGTTKSVDGVPVLDTASRWQAPDGTSVSPADGLRLAFELAADGKTHREIARALNLSGFRSTGNRGENPFTRDSVRVILANRFYIGELPDGSGGSLPGKHGALIDPALFERAQAMRDRNTHHPRRVSTVRTPWALSGVSTCGNCGAPLVLFGAGPRRRVQCSGRRQGNGCEAPTFFVETVEEQIGHLLDGFAVPTDARSWLLTAWRRNRSRHIDINAERIRLRGKLNRLSELYIEGIIDRRTFNADREAIQRDLASLPADTDPTDDTGRILAEYLADVGQAWKVATAAERNQIARNLFADVLVINKTAVAVVPRPEFRPFLELVHADAETCEDLSSVMSLRRKRRASGSSPRHGWKPITIGASSPRRVVGTSRRAPAQSPPPRQLDSDRLRRIEHLAGQGRSLREIAAEVGVSHETVRTALRRLQPVS